MRRNLLSLTLVSLAVFTGAEQAEFGNVQNQPENLFSTNLHTYGYNPEYISGNVTILKDLSNEERVLVGFKENHGHFVNFPAFIDMPICDAIKKYFNPYIKTMLRTGENTNLDFKDGSVCPLPKGKYWVKDIVLDSSKWDLPFWGLYGTYTVDVTVLHKYGTPGGKIVLQAAPIRPKRTNYYTY
ncbi:uncharacterized protein LOC108026583 [Drosophila biarmipes]|uniref:uncharacterized protein LOC108026583 n=1 Tax=Drosophila biarmipes TaxID=125945 RepID=UPI0007E60E19|nr:uncharacterized protein LOC108026583 [Drosophila biarmipes]